jgi:hypothetical protein
MSSSFVNSRRHQNSEKWRRKMFCLNEFNSGPAEKFREFYAPMGATAGLPGSVTAIPEF